MKINLTGRTMEWLREGEWKTWCDEILQTESEESLKKW